MAAFDRAAQARERPVWFTPNWGQQIRCDSEADGHSPDERDRGSHSHSRLRAGGCCRIARLEFWFSFFSRVSMIQTTVIPAAPQANSASAKAVRVAFIQSGWHDEIVDQGRASFIAEAADLGTPAQSITCFKVPGAFEIPLHAQKLARSGCFDAIVACGFVVNGGIYRHEFVADAVISGLMRVQLDTGVPVFSVVLTPLNFHEHHDHQQFFAQHFVRKGAEAAQACVETVQSLRNAERWQAA
jgi:6,7-dimethyl-8-ribityllumazine synthase